MLLEEVEEVVADRLVNDEARARQTYLAGVVVLPGRLLRCGIEVSVGKHHERPFPTQLGGEGHDVARCADPYVSASLR